MLTGSSCIKLFFAGLLKLSEMSYSMRSWWVDTALLLVLVILFHGYCCLYWYIDFLPPKLQTVWGLLPVFFFFMGSHPDSIFEASNYYADSASWQTACLREIIPTTTSPPSTTHQWCWMRSHDFLEKYFPRQKFDLYLVGGTGGFKRLLLSIIYGIILLIDFHIFQDC